MRTIVASGTFDKVADPADVKWLLEDSRLPKNNIIMKKSYDFGHNTFFLGADASYLEDDIIPTV